VDGGEVEILRKVFERWSAGDFATPVEEFDPGVELIIHSDIPEAGTYEGLEGVRRYMRGFLEPWERITIRALDYEQQGEKVLARVDQRGVSRSGAAVGDYLFQVWTFESGRVLRIEVTLSESLARESLATAD
jgi:ketosteroid isomerase-like protein